MVNRVSALEGHYETGRFGRDGDPGVILRELTDLQLTQVSFWPESVARASTTVASVSGFDHAPGAGDSVSTSGGAAMLRIEPLKWWLVDVAEPSVSADDGAVLDLSHSRTRISISGRSSLDLLSRHLPLDLRPGFYGAGGVASTVFHHVGVTLWQAEFDYQLFVPRGFAVSLWQMLIESSEQFGLEVA